APDFARLGELRVRGVIVTAAGGGGHDFVSRFFAPGSGIAEDPVTGSAHCCLAPFWGPRLGQEEMRGYQAAGRGGAVGRRLGGGGGGGWGGGAGAAARAGGDGAARGAAGVNERRGYYTGVVGFSA